MLHQLQGRTLLAVALQLAKKHVLPKSDVIRGNLWTTAALLTRPLLKLIFVEIAENAPVSQHKLHVLMRDNVWFSLVGRITWRLPARPW